MGILFFTSVSLFFLQSKQAGVIFLLSLIVIIYTLSIFKSKTLSKLKKYFDGVVKDLDEKYFGVKITNRFGKNKPLFYALVPFLKPLIQIEIEVLEMVSIIIILKIRSLLLLEASGP